jgi:hypothetical protein
MECGLKSSENKEICSERCKCKPDVSVHPRHLNKQAFRKTKMGISQVPKKHVQQIRKLFTKWLNKTAKVHQTEITRKLFNTTLNKVRNNSNALEDARYAFINKMLKNYEYYRRRQEELETLQHQHIKLNRQQKYLQKLLYSKEKQMKSHPRHDHKTSRNNSTSKPQNSMVDKGTKRKEFNKYAKTIEKQLADLQMEQKRLLNQQEFIENEVQKGEGFFNKMNLASQYDDGRVPDELMNAFTYDPKQQYQEEIHKMKQFEQQQQVGQQIQNQELQEEQQYLSPQEMKTMYASRQNDFENVRNYSNGDMSSNGDELIQDDDDNNNQEILRGYENMTNSFASQNDDMDNDDDNNSMYGQMVH